LHSKEGPQQITSRSDRGNYRSWPFTSGGAQISLRQSEKAFTIQDAATAIKGRHTLRFGAGRASILSNHRCLELWSTFTFASLAAYSSGQPEVFTMNLGIPRIFFTQREYCSFFQDEIQYDRTCLFLLDYATSAAKSGPITTISARELPSLLAS